MAIDLIRVVVDSSPAMLAYWNRDQRCVFANSAYLHWFGRTPESLIGMNLRELLGQTLYALNLPHIEAALRGERQEFERAIPNPSGGPPRHSQATYVPHIEDGEVHGFCVHVAEITELRNALDQVRTLQGLIPLCAWCRKIRNDQGYWTSLEEYLTDHTDASVTHGMCEACASEIER